MRSRRRSALRTATSAPGWVHGGALAAVFDQLLGFVLILGGTPCVTAERRCVITADLLIAAPAAPGSRASRGARSTSRMRSGQRGRRAPQARFVRLDPTQFADTLSTTPSSGGTCTSILRTSRCACAARALPRRVMTDELEAELMVREGGPCIERRWSASEPTVSWGSVGRKPMGGKAPVRSSGYLL